ncbi:MAG: lipocalin-like domain-containing protein [Paramuribaculum sp.]|nr:lipocalin-like domain-containing protein [Paramuribaculum sp.]
MKISLYILFILAAFVLAGAGCTRNNGNIGSWFGTWQVVSITSGEGKIEKLPYTVIVKFQSDIIQTTEQFGSHEYNDYWANWRRAGTSLIIDGVNKSIAPALMLPVNSVVELEIVQAPGSVMVWRYIDDNGNSTEYNLKRLY